LERFYPIHSYTLQTLTRHVSGLHRKIRKESLPAEALRDRGLSDNGCKTRLVKVRLGTRLISRRVVRTSISVRFGLRMSIAGSKWGFSRRKNTFCRESRQVYPEPSGFGFRQQGKPAAFCEATSSVASYEGATLSGGAMPMSFGWNYGYLTIRSGSQFPITPQITGHSE
jgi:hypothetical protein